MAPRCTQLVLDAAGTRGSAGRPVKRVTRIEASLAVVKRVVLAATGLLVGLVAINAVVEHGRKCGCPESCWCKTPAGRHLRWVLPLTHGQPLRQSRLG